MPFTRHRLLSSLLSLKKAYEKRGSGYVDLPRLIRQNQSVQFIPYLWESVEGEASNWKMAEVEKFQKIATWNTDLIKKNPKKYFLLNLQAGPFVNTREVKPHFNQKRARLITAICNYKRPSLHNQVIYSTFNNTLVWRK